MSNRIVKYSILQNKGTAMQCKPKLFTIHYSLFTRPQGGR